MHCGLVVGGYDQKSVASVDIVSDGPAKEDRALVDERVHERRMLVKALLGSTGTACIPGRAVALGDEVVTHTATVPFIVGGFHVAAVDQGARKPILMK